MIFESKINSGAKFVVNSLCPKILLVSSPKVEEIAKENELETFSNLLNPFAEDVSVSSRIIDGDGEGYYLTSLTIKFIDKCDAKKELKPNRKAISEWINTPPKENSNVNVSSENIQPGFFSTPWYDNFRDNWVKLVGETSFEAFGHPVITVLAASTQEEDPYATFKELLNHPEVENARKSHFSGADMMIYYLLVSNKPTGDPSVAIEQQRAEDGFNPTHAAISRDALYSELRQRLGDNTAVLDLNSSILSTEVAVSSSLWEKYYKTDPTSTVESRKAAGTKLMPSDLTEIRKTVKQIISQGLISHMQRQILLLSEQTSSIRKGITGRLFSAGRKYFIGAGNKQANKETDYYGEVFFLRGSTEFKLRKLADYLFMLKGYKTAQAIYSIASREFQSEQSNKCYAGAQEMAGLSKLLEPNKIFRDFESNILTALSSYGKSVWQSELYCFRAAIFYYELFKELGIFETALTVLQKVSKTSSFVPNALFFEQAFLVCLIIKRYRKAVLFNRLAGEQYELGDEFLHEYRCYTNKINSFFYQNWKKVKLQSNIFISNVSKKLNAQGKLLQCYQDLINDPLLETDDQDKYLKLIIEMLQDLHDPTVENNNQPRLDLTFPIIKVETIRLVVSSDSSGEDCIMDWGKTNSKPTKTNTSNTAWCSPGETVSFHVIVENPLKIPLVLNNVKLKIVFEAEDGEKSTELTESELPRCSEITEITLDPLIQSMLCLSIQSSTTGKLVITELCYQPNGALDLKKLFYDEPGHDEAQPQQLSDNIPSIIVSEQLPHLDIKLIGLPDSLLSGVSIMSNLVISNFGNTDVSAVNFWLSHEPQFYINESKIKILRQDEDEKAIISKEQEPHSYFKSLLSSTDEPYKKLTVDSTIEIKHFRKVKLDQPLAPGNKIIVPIYARCDSIDSFIFEFAVGYKGQIHTKLPTNEMRSFKFEVLCDVEPSLKLSSHVLNSAKSPKHHIISLQIENLRSTSMDIRQLSFITPLYYLVLLSEIPEKILPSQTISLNFFAKIDPEIVTKEIPETEQHAIRKFQQYVNKEDSSKSNSHKNHDLRVDLSFITFSRLGVKGQTIDLSLAPFIEYANWSKSFQKSEKLSKRFPFLKKKEIVETFGLYDSFNLDFYLVWGSGEEDLAMEGFSSLFDIEVETLTNVLDGTLKVKEMPSHGSILKSNKMEQQRLLANTIWNSICTTTTESRSTFVPVEVNMDFVDKSLNKRVSMTHFNLSAPGAFKLAVKCVLTNMRWNLSFSYTLKLTDPINKPKQLLGLTNAKDSVYLSPNSNPRSKSPIQHDASSDKSKEVSAEQAHWSWVGLTEISGKLKSKESKELVLEIICYEPGYIDLNQWVLVVDPCFSDTDNLTSVSKTQGAITINPQDLKPLLVL